MDEEGDDALPSGWAWARLDEIAEITGGITKNAGRSRLAQTLPYLRVANVLDGELCLRDLRMIGVGDAELHRARLRTDDLLFVEGNGSLSQIGRVALWCGEVDVCVHQNHLIKARFHEHKTAEWAMRWFQSPRGRQLIERVASSTSGLHTLSLSKISSLMVPLSPFPEQQRVLSEVRLLLEEALNADAAVGRARERAGEYRASLLHAACTGALTADWRAANPNPKEDGPALLRRILTERSTHGHAYTAQASTIETEGLPDIPSRWTWASIADLISDTPRNGISVKGSASPPGVAALRLDALREAGLDFSRRRFIQIPTKKANAIAIRAGDFLVSRANGSLRLVGKAAAAEAPTETTLFPDTMIRLRFLNPAVVRWIAIVWNSRLVRTQLEGRAKTSAGIWKLGQDDLLAVIIPLPGLDEAEAIAELLAEVAADEVDPSEDLSSLRQSILHAAFTGQLVAQNAADEPAAALLARLRAGASAVPTVRARRPRQRATA